MANAKTTRMRSVLVTIRCHAAAVLDAPPTGVTLLPSLGSSLARRFSTGRCHGDTDILPAHRLLLDIANMQKVPVSRCSLETADYSLTFVMVELGMEPIATKRGGEDPMIEQIKAKGRRERAGDVSRRRAHYILQKCARDHIGETQKRAKSQL